MSELINDAIVLKGRLKKDGVTFYTKNGKTIMRSAISEQPHRRTRGQFMSRQRLAHNITLWKRLREPGKPVFAGGGNNYGRFCTLMRKAPLVYLTKQEHAHDSALLLPGMPVSDGVLPNVEYLIGEVGGRPALLTSLRLTSRNMTILGRLRTRGGGMEGCDTLRLYRFVQTVRNQGPWLDVTFEDLDLTKGSRARPFSGVELCEVGGNLALVGDEFGDATRGWALVRMADGRVSSQTVVTGCRLYEGYATEKALQRSAESYGGLTGEEETL